jgi:hypothetical protein
VQSYFAMVKMIAPVRTSRTPSPSPRRRSGLASASHVQHLASASASPRKRSVCSGRSAHNRSALPTSDTPMHSTVVAGSERASYESSTGEESHQSHRRGGRERRFLDEMGPVEARILAKLESQTAKRREEGASEEGVREGGASEGTPPRQPPAASRVQGAGERGREAGERGREAGERGRERRARVRPQREEAPTDLPPHTSLAPSGTSCSRESAAACVSVSEDVSESEEEAASCLSVSGEEHLPAPERRRPGADVA